MILHSPADLGYLPKRIISLVPSQTELLFYLGLDEAVAGITKFCVHPQEWKTNKTIIGGTKNINLQKIKQLQPDLIIANKEENTQQQLELLMNEFPVWISDIKTLDDAQVMIEQIGLLTNRWEKAKVINNAISKEFMKLDNFTRATAAYFIWNEPMMTVGADTFINDMMNRCGFMNVFADQLRYPEISAAELKKAHPEFILLSSEPFPFQEKHLVLFRNISIASKIILVDGEMFSWYGSRLIKAPSYFIDLRKN